MKKLFVSLSVIGLLFASCTKSDEVTEVVNSVSVNEISGTYTADKTFPKGNYTLKGIVKIASGAVVTFEAGSVITCDRGVVADNALVVLNGGKLIIKGTESQPVVFTEKSKIPGSWGGITMYGDAPAKVAGGGSSSSSEDGNNFSYGGSNTAHNGGSLAYVRVEYAGSKLGDGKSETNGFTFYSVGSGTTLDHLVAYKGADDGFEFFGGTVSMTNAVSYGNFDDAFDWQDGWQGQKNSNWYAYQTVKGNYGMEIEASSNNNDFYPKVSGITLKRDKDCIPEVGDNQVDAFQFKKEGNGEFDNVVIDGYQGYKQLVSPFTLFESTVVRIEDKSTNTNQVATSKIKVTNLKATNTNILTPAGRTMAKIEDQFTVSFPTTSFKTIDATTGAVLTNGNWSMVDGVSLIK